MKNSQLNPMPYDENLQIPLDFLKIDIWCKMLVYKIEQIIGSLFSFQNCVNIHQIASIYNCILWKLNLNHVSSKLVYKIIRWNCLFVACLPNNWLGPWLPCLEFSPTRCQWSGCWHSAFYHRWSCQWRLCFYKSFIGCWTGTK